MFEETIASGAVEVRVEVREAERALRQIEADYERTIKNIDRMEGEASIGADLNPLKDDLANARRELRKLNGEKVKVWASLDEKGKATLKKDIAAAKAQVAKLDGEVAQVEIKVKGTENVKKAEKATLDATLARLKAAEKAYADATKTQERLDAATEARRKRDAKANLARVNQQARVSAALRRQQTAAEKALAADRAREEKDNLARINREARVSASLRRQQATEAKAREAVRVREETARERQIRIDERESRNRVRAAKQRDRELAQVPKLEREYALLQERMERINEARRKAKGDERATFLIDLEARDIQGDLTRIRNTVHARIGRDPVGLPVELTLGRRAGERLRQEIGRNVGKSGGAAALAIGASIGGDIGRGVGRGFKRTMDRGFMGNVDLAKDVTINVATKGLEAAGRGLGRFTHMLQGLSEMTVRLGPFTASIRQAVIVLSLFAPIILDVVGALGSLVSVTGSAVLGLGALGAGMLSGVVPAFLGTFLAVKDVAGEFKHATELSKAYHKALAEGNEELAAKKLKAFNHVLGDADKRTKEAYLSAGTLGDRWTEMTAPSRTAAFGVIGEALHLADTRMGQFADRTNEFTKSAGGGLRRMIRGLDTDAINDSMKNTTKAIGPLLDGMGNFLNYILRVGASASRYFPGISRDFKTWSKSLLDTTEAGEGFNEKIDRTMDSLSSLGRFLMSAGRLMKAFFGGGVESGQNFLDVMSESMDGWTRFLKTTEGQESLRDFFDEAVRGSRALFNTLAPIIGSFVRWAQVIAPVARDFFEAAAYVSNFVAQLLRVTGLQGELSGIVTTLGLLWGLGRIRKAAQAVQGFTTALLGMNAASKASTVAGAADNFANNVDTPGGRTKAGRGFKSLFMGGIKKAGLVGVGLTAMSIIGNSIQDASQRSGFKAQAVQVSHNILHGITFGLHDSAEEAGKKTMDRMRKGIEAGARYSFKGRGQYNNLTDIQKAFLQDLQRAIAAGKRLATTAHLPAIKLKANLDPKPALAGIATLEMNFRRLDNNLAGSLSDMRRHTRESMDAIAATMGLNSASGKAAVQRNFAATAITIERKMAQGTTSVKRGMREIHTQFVIHSRASKQTTQANFHAAEEAIKLAVDNSVMSSKRGNQEINKLWVEYLGQYGFTPKQARNIRKGNSYTGGPDEGTRSTPGNPGAKKASGGWIGSRGERGRDTVPALLGRGEAVLNQHQQRPVDTALQSTYGIGLNDLFDRVQTPHYASASKQFEQSGRPMNFAAGGIVPVPGFPGESAASSIIPKIENVVHRWPSLVLTDAYGQGHQSPGHTVTGTAADFSGPDGAMDSAVQSLVKAGYLVGYDGRFGSQDWPGHGPSTRTPNYHLHVEFGGKGGAFGAIEAPTIDRPIVDPKYGMMSFLGQAAVDTSLAAAQSNLDAVAQNSVTIPTSGGHAAPGAGAASREQMVKWATQALTFTGVGASPGNIEKILTLAMKESSWIVRSMNNWDVNAKAGNPSGGLMHVTLDKVGNSMERLFDPVANMVASIKYQIAKYGGLITRSPYAEGGFAELKDMFPQRASKLGGKISEPTLMTGESSTEFVINPERKDNFKYLKAAAAAMGVDMADDGKSGKGKKKRKTDGNGLSADREGKYRKAGHIGNAKEVKRYNKLVDDEDDLNTRIGLAERRVIEPETLIKETGETDAEGNKLYTLDTAAIATYTASMNAVLKLQEQLPKLMQEMLRAFHSMMARIASYSGNRRNSIERLKDSRDRNDRLAKEKLPPEGKTKAEKERRKSAEARRKKAIQRRDADQSRIDDEKEKLDEATSLRGEMAGEDKEIGYREQGYWLDQADLKRNIAAVDPRAGEELTGANPSAETGTGEAAGAGGISYGEQQVAFDTERANILKEYGSNYSLISGSEAGIGRDPARPAAANPISALTGAADALTGSSAALTGALTADARPGTAAGAFPAASALSSSASADRAMSGSSPSVAAGIAGVAAAGATNNYYVQPRFEHNPPDPHTWTQGVAFEIAGTL